MASLLGRHYCSVCNGRVSPYDSFEARTMAPERGPSGRDVLLWSHNQRLSQQGETSRLAWCWQCDDWTVTYRLTRADVALMYARRRGVTFRATGRGEAALVREIEGRMEARRERTGT